MKKKKILFVDDDTDTRDIVSFILADAEVELVQIAEAPDVAEIAETEPHLILLDEWLPNKKGSELCLELKSKKRTAHIPVVLISAFCGLETIAKNCRADGFIHKPFDIEQLKQVVSNCLMAV